MKAPQIAAAARLIESRRMNKAREFRSRAEGKPAEAAVPRKQGRCSIILDFGLAEVNAAYDVLKGNRLTRETMKGLEEISRKIVTAWISRES